MLKTGVSIVRQQVWIVILGNLGERETGIKQFKHALNSDPCSGHTGLAKMNFGINSNFLDHLAPSYNQVFN